MSRIIALVATLLLVGCSAPPPATPAAPVSGEQRDERQTLTIGTQGLASTLIPQDTAVAWYQYWFMYDSLTQLGRNFEPRPSIAEKWELAADGMSWTFTIRKGVMWPSGEELTATDVAFTLSALIEKTNTIRQRIANVTSVRQVGDNQVQLMMNRQDVSVPNNGAFLWIFPKKQVEAAGGLDAFAAKPVGSGPYELVEFKTADSLRFKKKASHAFREPIADEVIVRAIPESSQLISGLRTGEIDLVANGNFTIEQVRQLTSGGFNVNAPLSNNYYMILMAGAAQLRQSPLTDRRVRYAINYAVDRAAIARQFFGEYAQPTGQQAVPGSLYYDPDAKPWPYDVAQAKRLLAEAGYPNGFKLTQGIVFTPSRTPTDIALAIKGFLAEIGIDAPTTQLEVGAWSDAAFGRNGLQQPDILATFSAESDGFYTNWRSVAGCDRPVAADRTKSWTCNAQWDTTFDQAIVERDPAKRAEIFRRANRIFQEDAPVIFEILGPQIAVTTPKIRGLDIPNPVAYNLDAVYRVK